MSFLSIFAVYFIIWWLTLFAVLPLGMRSQAEDGDVTLGTVASAPSNFRGLRVVLLTTAISAVIYGIWFVASNYLGFNLNSLPRFVPEFN
jgi:predicted secreted protein